MSDAAATGRPDETWTIKRVLDWTRGYLEKCGSTSARVDSELLLAAALDLPRLQLYLAFDKPLADAELAAYRRLIRRRARREPVAYILGQRGFHAIDVEVTPEVLIPRPETERLVDLAVAFLGAADAPEGDVLDLCTGSGAIALAIATECDSQGRPRSVLATDCSAGAVAVARRNRDALGLGSVHFAVGDLFAAVDADRRFAAIVCNPPYVRSEDWARLDADVRDHEPRLALDGGADGLDLVRRIAVTARQFLVDDGLIALEVGSRVQAEATCRLIGERGFAEATVEVLGPGPTCTVAAKASA